MSTIEYGQSFSSLVVTPKKIIIIGATSGIGRELATGYLTQNCSVGITGRRQNLLNEMEKKFPGQVYKAVFDIMDGNNISQLKILIHQLGGMDLLVYNAGVGEPSEQLNEKMEMVTVKTNVTGFVEVVSYAFNYFLQQGYGQIAVTSSIAALRGNSWAPAYSASKSFMSVYAEGLNIKAQKLKKAIVVTDIKPGFVDTKMAKGNRRFWVAQPQKAAHQMIKAIEKKKRVAYVTRRWWLIAQLLKMVPYSLYRRLA